MWRACDNAYYGVKKELQLNDSEREYRSNIRVRYCYKQVESQTSKIVPSIINQEPPCSVFPNDENNEIREAKAKAIQKILRYYALQKQNGLSLIYRWIKQGERYGLSPLKLIWAYEEGHKVQRTPVIDARGRVIGIKREESDEPVVTKDCPELFLVNAHRIWWNNDATDPDTDLRFVYEDCWLPLDKVKKSDLYFNTEQLQPETSMDEWDTSLRDSQARYLNIDFNRMVKVTERWDKDTLIAVCQGRLIRYRDNPFDDHVIPYFFYRSTVLDNEFCGMGTIEPSLELEELANTIHNQRLDNVHRIIHKMIFVGATAGWKGNKRLRFRPGGVEHMLDINQVKEFQMQDVTASSYIEVDKATKLLDDINGDPEVGRGEQPSKRETATSVSVRTQGASFRIEMKTLFAQLELGRMYRGMYCLEKQFGDKAKLVRILGTNGIEHLFTHDEVFTDDYEFDYTLNGYTGNRLIDFQQFMLGVQSLGASGLIGEFDGQEIAKVFAERTNMRGVDRILKKPPIMMDGYNRDPYDENNRMFWYAQPIGVLPGEPHGKHIPVHQKLSDVMDLPADIKQIVMEHLAQHVQMMLADQQAQLGMKGQIGAQQGMAQSRMAGPTTPIEASSFQAAGPMGMTQGGANVQQRGLA
jgi:hypothetical protein